MQKITGFSIALLLLAVGVVHPPPAMAQRCVKGIPCGNSCIAANKTCRVGAGTAVKAAGNAGLSQPTKPNPRVGCVIKRVIDGDTVECEPGTSVRLLMIDAPEMDQGDFGKQAKNRLQEILPIGTRVELEYDAQMLDRYYRVLAYIFHNGDNLNRRLAREGLAVVELVPPNVKYVEAIRAAADSARSTRVGLWAVDAFACMPADHRAGRCK